jgi:phosphate transport system ATP-binding protein
MTQATPSTTTATTAATHQAPERSLRPEIDPMQALPSADRRITIQVKNLHAYYGKKHAVGDVSMDIRANSVTALIGPSGCGKSTLIRTFNRMHEFAANARVEGEVLLETQNIYAPGVDPVRVRQRMGMVFQKPNPFPTMSIAENVASGLRFLGMRSRSEIGDRVESSLKRAALWDEVKNDLKKPGIALSGGQQQRLCIARAIAVEPEVVLMDEPCSALDPIATLKIEDLMRELARSYTIVVVTHNMQQAARTSDYTAFMLAGNDGIGRLVEYAPTVSMFTNPSDSRTEDYITGRFG